MEIQNDNYPDDEYITNENDPTRVLIVPEDDYVISDNEEIIQHDKIITTIQGRTQSEMEKSDFIIQEKVLDALRKGKLR